MERIVTIRLDETDSTNRYLRDYRGEEGELMTVVTARYQTAGRGQGANKWESERGKNLTFSVKVRPKSLPAGRQYVLTEAMALAIRSAVAKRTGEATIKWPNDIYVGDMKISGTLSECSIVGTNIGDCILGSGINVNQERFFGDAPNPTSLRLITRRSHDPEDILADIIGQMERYMAAIDSGDHDGIRTEYHAHLYRREGFHPYSDANGRFTARIVEVLPDGRIVMEREDGSRNTYSFKEITTLPQ